MNVKPKLMALLKERNITQMQLSEISGIPQGSISRFDRNDRHVDAHLFAIAKALDVRVEDLFEVTD
jgi:transcriptional regulator with XRE-family HTH domain